MPHAALPALCLLASLSAQAPGRSPGAARCLGLLLSHSPFTWPAALLCRPREPTLAAISRNSRPLAPLAVALRLLPSAERGDAPGQRSGLGRCPGTGRSILQTFEMFGTAPLACISFKSLLPLRKIRRILQHRNGRQQLTLMCLSPWTIFSLRNAAYVRDAALAHRSFCAFSPLTSDGIAMIQKLLTENFLLPLVPDLGKPKSTLVLSSLFCVRFLWCAVCLIQW